MSTLQQTLNEIDSLKMRLDNMDKSIEKKFFSAFEMGGVVYNCIDWIRDKYDLGYLPQSDNKKQGIANLLEPYAERINTKIQDFDDTVIMSGNTPPLIEEIDNNLRECTTNKDKERYLLSILRPFKSFSDVFYPKELIDQTEREIASIKQDKILWQSLSNNNDQAEVQIKACDNIIDRRIKTIERYQYISDQFRQLLNENDCNDNIEGCMTYFVSVVGVFSNRLDALLLTYGIDLIKLQNDCGIYLKSRRCITDVDYYIGSLKLAQKYIDDLKHTPTKMAEPPASTTPKQPASTISTDIESLLTCSEAEKKIWIDRIKRVQAQLPNNKPKTIATFLFAIHKEGVISLSNVRELATAYFNTFGYKTNTEEDKHCIINSMHYHIQVGTHLNKNDIEMYRDKLNE